MESAMKFFKHQDPKGYNRILEILKTTKCHPSFEVSITKELLAQGSFPTFLHKVEVHLCKKIGFNMILKGLPEKAPLSETDEEETIGYEHVRDTMKQFGHLISLRIIGDTAYIKFVKREESVKTHRLINNMMMGQNIIKTVVC
jgi:hypothetical protein